MKIWGFVNEWAPTAVLVAVMGVVYVAGYKDGRSEEARAIYTGLARSMFDLSIDEEFTSSARGVFRGLGVILAEREFKVK